MRQRIRGFTLIELLVAIAIIGVLLAILLPAIAGARRSGRMAVCFSHLQQFGRAHASYGADFKDFIAAFSGRPEDLAFVRALHSSGGLQNEAFTFPILADCNKQAVSILESHGVRADSFVASGDPSGFPVAGAKTIVEQHSHLVLIDYMGEKALNPSAACPEDRARISWQKNPGNMASSSYRPLRRGNTPTQNWLPYSSSYQLLPAGWLADAPRNTRFGFFYFQSTSHDTYSYTSAKSTEPIGGRHLADVLFPAQKVAISDSQQRHFGKDLYFAYPQARQPLLFWDGAASIRRTSDGNPGWDRQNIRSAKGTVFTYLPDPGFESPPPSSSQDGFTEKLNAAYYKWTRGGLQGIDFAGGEADTSRW